MGSCEDRRWASSGPRATPSGVGSEPRPRATASLAGFSTSLTRPSASNSRPASRSAARGCRARRPCTLVRFSSERQSLPSRGGQLLGQGLGDEAVAEPGLGDYVPRRGRIGLHLPSQRADVHANGV